jgi:opacity protein-like surface antigen
MIRTPNVFPQPGYGLPAALALLALSLAPLAAAATTGGPAVALRAGEAGSDYERIGVSVRLTPLWSSRWGNWQVSALPELELSHFRYSGPAAAGPDSLNQIGAIALLHLHHGDGRVRPYVEAGLGASLFSDDRLGNKDFSTRFQFSEHLGLGLEFSGRWFAGLQYSHYSNADIDKPNDGVDLHQIVVGMHF